MIRPRPILKLYLLVLPFFSIGQSEGNIDIKFQSRADFLSINVWTSFPFEFLDGKFYELRFDKEAPELVQYSNNSVARRIPIDVSKSGLEGEVYFSKLFEFNDNYYAVLRKHSKAQKDVFFLQRFSMEEYELEGKLLEIGTSDLYKIGNINGFYSIGSPKVIKSKNEKYLLIEVYNTVDEKDKKATYLLLDREFNEVQSEELLLGEIKKSDYAECTVTCKGKIVVTIRDSEYFEAYYSGAKDLPQDDSRLVVFSKQKRIEFSLNKNGEPLMGVGVDYLKGDSLYIGGLFTYFKEKKSKEPTSYGLSVGLINLDAKDSEEMLISYETFPLVYNDFNKYLTKEKLEKDEKYYKKNGFYKLSFWELGTKFTDGVMYIAVQRYSYYNSDFDMGEAITVFKISEFSNPNPPDVAYIPMQSTLSDDVEWFAARGQAYFLMLTESSNLGRKFSFDKVPKRTAHFTKKLSLCVVQPNFEEKSNCVLREIENSLDFDKSVPRLSWLYINENSNRLAVLCYKQSAMGSATDQHFRFYTVNYSD